MHVNGFERMRRLCMFADEIEGFRVPQPSLNDKSAPGEGKGCGQRRAGRGRL